MRRRESSNVASMLRRCVGWLVAGGLPGRSWSVHRPVKNGRLCRVPIRGRGGGARPRPVHSAYNSGSRLRSGLSFLSVFFKMSIHRISKE